MPSLYRTLVPRRVSKALNPVNVPSLRSVVQPSVPRVRTPRRRSSTSRKRTTR